MPGRFSTETGGILVQATSSQLDHIDAEKAESTLKLVVFWPPKKLADPEAVAEATTGGGMITTAARNWVRMYLARNGGGGAWIAVRGLT